MYSLRKIKLVIFFFVALILINISCISNELTQKQRKWFDLLVSSKESNRWQSFNSADTMLISITAPKVLKYFSEVKECNIGMFIYILTKYNNNLIYELPDGGINLLSKYESYFPNGALYFSKVQPQQGYKFLIELYKKYPRYRLIICKSIGLTQSKESKDFLLKKIEDLQKNKKNCYNEIIGLSYNKKKISTEKFLDIMSNTNDRESLLALSKINSDFSEKELLKMWNGTAKQRNLTLEFILNNFDRYKKIFYIIVDRAIENKNYDLAKLLLNGDTIRRKDYKKVIEYLRKIETIEKNQKK